MFSDFKKIFFLLTLALTLAPMHASGQADPLKGLENIGKTVYGQQQGSDLKDVIANVVQVVLGFVGIIFLVLVIWAGFQWMTSGGNEEKIKMAKRHLVNASIGLVIIFTSYAIASFIARSIGGAV